MSELPELPTPATDALDEAIQGGNPFLPEKPSPYERMLSHAKNMERALLQSVLPEAAEMGDMTKEELFALYVKVRTEIEYREAGDPKCAPQQESDD